MLVAELGIAAVKLANNKYIACACAYCSQVCITCAPKLAQANLLCEHYFTLLTAKY
jgi:hypothetical protein